MLTARRIVPDEPGEHKPRPFILHRELGRQSFLIAAREEFGLATRDMLLGEAIDPKSPHYFDAAIYSYEETGTSVDISRAGQKVSSAKFAGVGDKTWHYMAELAWEEELSRTQHVDALRKLGYQRAVRARNDTYPLPADALSALNRMDHISQFHAVRRIHQELRDHGDSPELLSGLARGYAHLAFLTQPAIDNRYLVFMARAWLYSQRLIALFPASPSGYWTRADVMSWTGAPNQTEVDLRKAAEMGAPALSLPAWAKLADFYSQYNYMELKKLAEDESFPEREIAAVQMFRTVRVAYSRFLMVHSGDAALMISPHCLSLMHYLVERNGDATIGGENVSSFVSHAKSLQQALPRMNDLPGNAVAAAQTMSPTLKEIHELAKLLIAAGSGDRAEPSWAALGQTILAWNLEHLFEEAHIQLNVYDSSPSRFVSEHDELFRGQPTRTIFQALAMFPQADINTLRNMRPEAPLFELNVHSFCYFLVQRFGEVMDFGEKDGEFFGMYTEPTAGRFEEGMYRSGFLHSQEWQIANIRRLEEMAARSPYVAQVKLMNVKQEVDPADLKRWEADSAQQPDLLPLLAIRAGRRQDYPSAVNLLKQFTKIVPGDLEAHSRLAYNLYWSGDEKWLESASDALACQDLRNNHAELCRIVATTLMRDGRAAEARPWAERVARYQLDWGHSCLIDCLTLQGDFAAAEQKAKAASELFSNLDWLDWCVETGKGDLDGAMEWLNQRPEISRQFSASNHYVLPEITSLMVQGDLKSAETRLGATARCDFLRALLADRLQDKASRDSQLRRISTYPARNRIFQGRTPLAKLFIQHMDTPTELRKAVLAFLAEKQPEGIFPAEAEFSLAFYLQTRGMKDLAIEHYSNAARVPARDPYRVLAWHFLRKEGIDPVQLPGRNHQSALEPAKKPAPGTNP